MMTLKYHIETNSDLRIDEVKEKIITILKRRKYDIKKVTYNTISFDNGLYIIKGASKDRVVRVERGTFYLVEEQDKIKVSFTYEISYIALILVLLTSAIFGFLIDSNFFLVAGVAMISWPIYYLILKTEAAELIDVFALVGVVTNKPPCIRTLN